MLPLRSPTLTVCTDNERLRPANDKVAGDCGKICRLSLSGDGGQVGVDVATIPDPVDNAPAHDTGRVDQERAAHRDPGLLVEDTVCTSHRTVRPVVGQELEGQVLGLGICPQS